MENKTEIVAEKARATFEKIRELRKSHPQRFAWERKKLEEKVNRLKAQWWSEAKEYMNGK